MALKGWKKVGKNQWEYFRHIRAEDAIWSPYLVEINSYSKTGKKTDKIKTWEVRVWSITEDILEEKKFKTKSAALKFARAYMRKH